MSASSLDPAYTGDGKQEINLFTQDNLAASTTQNDGKTILVSTNNNELIVTRLNKDGGYDGTFGKNGIKHVAFGDNYHAAAVSVAPGGKVVVVGNAFTSLQNNYVVVTRLNSDGSLDKTFTYNGAQGSNYYGMNAKTFYGSIKGQPFARAVNVRGDGSIIVGGSIDIDMPSGPDDRQMMLMKLKPQGGFDTTFGTNHNGTTNYEIVGGQQTHHDSGEAMAVTYSGKILLAGDTSGNATNGFQLTQFNSDGTVDYNFGYGGSNVASFANQLFTTASSVAIDGNGYVIVGGNAWIKNQGSNWGLAMFRPNGKLATEWDKDGKKVINPVDSGIDHVTAVTFDGDNKVLAAGIGQLNGNQKSDFSVIRFNYDGKMDSNFGFGGYTSADFGGDDVPTSMNWTSGGRLQVVGTTTKSNSSNIAIAQFVGHAPTFTIQSLKSLSKEGSNPFAQFLIHRDGDPYDGAYDLDWTVTGFATKNKDYTMNLPTHWLLGQSTMLIQLDVIDDKSKEGIENVVIKLNPTKYYDTPDDSNIITIYDND